MQFPNAYKGVSKIFIAQVLVLVADVVGIVVSGLYAAQNNSVNALIAGLGVAVGVITIIAFILNLLGLIDAKKDEGRFGTALFIMIAAIVLSCISVAFAENETVTNVFKQLTNICEVLVTFYVISGIITLAKKLNDEEMAAKGKRIITMVVAAWALAIIAGLVASFIKGSDAALAVSAVLLLISAIVGTLAVILYVLYLAKAKKMLAK